MQINQYVRNGIKDEHLVYARKNYNKFIVFLSILSYSFPVLSLIDDKDQGSSSISLFTIPSVISIILLSIYAFFNIHQRVRVVFLLLLTLWTVLVFYFFSKMHFYDVDKFQNFYAVSILFGFLLFITLFVKEVRGGLDLILLGSGVLGLFLLVLNPTEYDAGRITYGDSNPIWMGRVLGVGALAAVAVAINRPPLRLPAIGIFLLTVLSVLATGSRGPFLSVFLSIAAAFGLKRFSGKYTIVISFSYVILILFIVIYGFFPDYFRALSFGRINDESFDHRSNMLIYSLEIISSTPDGIGIGQFFFNGFTYPHNIIIESFVEWGWWYGIIYSLFLIGGVFSCLVMEKRFFLLPILAVFDFLNAIVSGDMTSPRFLYGISLYGWYLLFASFGAKRRKESPGSGGIAL